MFASNFTGGSKMASGSSGMGRKEGGNTGGTPVMRKKVEDDSDTSSEEEEEPLLMIHGSHMAVDWDQWEPYVNSKIPTSPSDIDGNGAFIKLDDPVYLAGGKVFRAKFHWATEVSRGQGSVEKSENKDVMLCRVGMCNVCHPTLASPAAAGNTVGKPFVHHTCVDFNAGAGGPHPFKAFAPKAGLKADYPRPYPATGSENVVFEDGELRDVLICVPTACTFCKEINASNTPKKQMFGAVEKSSSEKKKALGKGVA